MYAALENKIFTFNDYYLMMFLILHYVLMNMYCRVSVWFSVLVINWCCYHTKRMQHEWLRHL